MFVERSSTKNCLLCWRGLCLLLAFSFLYNPFMAAAASGGGLNVSHAASYRATVAASELQQLAPMDDGNAAFVSSFFFVVDAGPVLPEPLSQVLLSSALELSAPQPIFSSNLWFRPPPEQ